MPEHRLEEIKKASQNGSLAALCLNQKYKRYENKKGAKSSGIYVGIETKIKEKPALESGHEPTEKIEITQKGKSCKTSG